MAGGRRLLWAPIALLAAVALALLFVAPERKELLSNWPGHAEYAPMFAFGFVLAGSPSLWPAVARAFRPALAFALLGGKTVVAIEVRYPAEALPPHTLMAA